MELPTQALLILLQVVRGKKDWDDEAFEACIDILRYAYHSFVKFKLAGDAPEMGDFNPEEAIASILKEEAQEVKSLAPGVWISLALWVGKMLVEKWMK